MLFVEFAGMPVFTLIIITYVVYQNDVVKNKVLLKAFMLERIVRKKSLKSTLRRNRILNYLKIEKKIMKYFVTSFGS